MKIIKNGYNSRSLRKLTILTVILSLIFSACFYLAIFYKNEDLLRGTFPCVLLSLVMGMFIPGLIYEILTFEPVEYEVGDRVMINKNGKLGHISNLLTNSHRKIYVIDGHGYYSNEFTYVK